MKVTIDHAGTQILVEDDDVRAIAEFVLALNGHQKQPKRSRKKKPEPSPASTVNVSPQAYETWQWLVSHDAPAGVSATEVGTGLGIKTATASYRLNQLVKHGLAHRTSRGLYRPGESSA